MSSRALGAGSALIAIAAIAAALAGGCKRSRDQQREGEPGGPALPPQSAGDLGAPLAKIDGVTITVGDLQERINQQSPYVRGRYTSFEHKREFLTNLIRFEVLALEAKRRGLDKDPDVVRAMKQVMIQKLMKDQFDNAVTPDSITEQEMRAYYEKNRARYDKPAQVRVAAIVVRGKSKAASVAKLAEGKNGSTNAGYRDLVERYSVDAETKVRGGDLRYFSRENREIPKPVIDAAFALERTGDVAGPIDAGDGRFFIIKKTGQRRAVTKPFDKVKMQIRNRLYRTKHKQAQRRFIEDLKKKSKIKVFEDNLRKVRVDTSKASVAPGGAAQNVPAMPPETAGAPQNK